MSKRSSSQISIHDAWPTAKRTNLRPSRTREDEDLSQRGSPSEGEVNADSQGASTNFPEVGDEHSDQSSGGEQPAPYLPRFVL